MNKIRKIALILLLAMVIPLIATLVLLSNKSVATSFTFHFSYSHNTGLWAPFHVPGIGTIYCYEHGSPIDDGTVYNSGESGDLVKKTSPGFAYAFASASDDNVRQWLMWRGPLAHNSESFSGTEISGYDEATTLLSEEEAFNKYYNKLQEVGKNVTIEKTEYKLQGLDGDNLKIGPFKLKFLKSRYSYLKDLYLEDNNGKRIDVSQINFGGYTGGIADINSEEEFYVLLPKSTVEQNKIESVKLRVNFHYTEVSGTYTYYNPANPTTNKGADQQNLIQANAEKHGQDTDYVETEQIPITIDLAGKVFKDIPTKKVNEINGILDSEDVLINGIKVNLYRKDVDKDLSKPFMTTVTAHNDKENTDGYYEFTKLLAIYNYFITYEYNGMYYEPTTYQRLQIDGKDTKLEERSYATDGKKNRQDFNKKFDPVDGTTNTPQYYENGKAPTEESTRQYIPAYTPEFNITAFTGKDGQDSLDTYGLSMKDSNGKELSSDDVKIRLKNINFGIRDREHFDLNLVKDLRDVKVSINGKSQTYEYDGIDEDFDVKLRGEDLAGRGSDQTDYNRTLRESDLKYKDNLLTMEDYQNNPDKLQVLVTYVIQVKNQTVGGDISGFVTKLTDYSDDGYVFVGAKLDDAENGQDVKFTSEGTVQGQEKSYQKMSTTDLKDHALNTTNAERMRIYMTYQVTPGTLNKVLTQGLYRGENFAEIAGYRNTYANDVKDLNGQVIHAADETAGLIDIDSQPANLNPTSEKVQSFVAKTKTQEWQQMDGVEKTKASREVFEDDADVAPGIRFILDTTSKRTMEGNVFEDSALKEKLDVNERVGNGISDSIDHSDDYNASGDPENKLNAMKVELLEVGDNADSVNQFLADQGKGGIAENNTPSFTNNLIQNSGNAEDNNARITRTDASGNYSFTGYIPGKYILKFTYGDKTFLEAPQYEKDGTTEFNPRKVYSGQDYQSTLYDDSKYANNTYWYNDTSLDGANKATDVQKAGESYVSDSEPNREKVTELSKTLTNKVANSLDTTWKTANQDLKNTTFDQLDQVKMLAKTAVFDLEVEKKDQQVDSNTAESNQYDIPKMDFGFIERPRSDVIVNKDVSNFKLVTAGDGNTIFDTNQKAQNLTWRANTQVNTNTQDYGKKLANRNLKKGLVQATVDQNLIHGATLELQFKINVQNVGEIDYTDPTYQKTGDRSKANSSTLVTYTPTKLVDYVSNNLAYNGDYQGNSDRWEEYSKDKIDSDLLGQNVGDDKEIVAAKTDGDILKNKLNSLQKIVRLKDTSVIGKSLLPTKVENGQIATVGGKEVDINGGTDNASPYTTITLTKVLAGDNEEDTQFDNAAEITESTTQNGRRTYDEHDNKIVTSIPGNYSISYNGSDGKTYAGEPDTAESEHVSIVPPFGARDIIKYSLIALAVLVVLGAGVYLIRRVTLGTGMENTGKANKSSKKNAKK